MERDPSRSEGRWGQVSVWLIAVICWMLFAVGVAWLVGRVRVRRVAARPRERDAKRS